MEEIARFIYTFLQIYPDESSRVNVSIGPTCFTFL